MHNTRVSIKEGKEPILIIAPHGFNDDDKNTGHIAECIGNLLDCYYVINNGWERNDSVDCLKDKADCNNVLHCHEDVVKEEFLDPILKFKRQILKKHEFCFIYMIHGMSDLHRKLSGNSNLDFVIGHGAGNPNSFSCEPWRKDIFISFLQKMGYTTFEGKTGGPMSGWSKNNMNQLFRKWYPDKNVQSMQIEIIHEIRQNQDVAALLAEDLATTMQRCMSDVWIISEDFTTEKY